MYNIIKVDLNDLEKKPVILLEFFGGLRIRYHFMLLSPQGNGEILQEWRGNNWDKVKDEFSIEFGERLEFAPLSWQFDIFPNPSVPVEKYRILFNILQNGSAVFTREYENTLSKPEIISDDAVFIPS